MGGVRCKQHLDLFSGIGGFALAAKWAGIQTVQFVEIDQFCQKVLRKNFPKVPIHDDIKTFKWTEPSPFLITGGFPCQPFSCAGKRRGKEDDRYLWPEMLRIISETKSRWIICENVAGIRSMEFSDSIPDVEGETDIQENRKDDYTTVLDGICNDLEAIGYEVQPFIIPACAVNAPHRRDRVWIIGHSEGAEQKSSWNSRKRRIRFTNTNRNASNTEWRENWFEVATRLCRVDDGVPDELYKLETSDRVERLEALGNAIVPRVAYQIIRTIVEVETTMKAAPDDYSREPERS